VLGAVAVAELPLLLQAPRHPAGFAAVVLAVQAVGAVLAFALALRKDNGAPPTPEISPEIAPELTPERAYNRSTAAVTSEPG
jgi:hypothetical protein